MGDYWKNFYLSEWNNSRKGEDYSLQMFHCSSGECIPENYVCNGNGDCLDGTDERNCPSTMLNDDQDWWRIGLILMSILMIMIIVIIGNKVERQGKKNKNANFRNHANLDRSDAAEISTSILIKENIANEQAIGNQKSVELDMKTFRFYLKRQVHNLLQALNNKY